jgi:hypothetical protein
MPFSRRQVQNAARTLDGLEKAGSSALCGWRIVAGLIRLCCRVRFEHIRRSLPMM